ncbi:MAG: glycogen debranching enzyme, partial [Candidatus Sulfotelmatobacter sp.]
LMGDEVRRTQHGNNNAFCHDNDISWFDWGLLTKHFDVHRFVRLLCARRSLRNVEHENARLSLVAMLMEADKAWHGTKLNQPDWGDNSFAVALEAELRPQGLRGYFIFNAYWEPLDFELPQLLTGKAWRRWIDTALDSPHDIVDWQQAQSVSGTAYRAEARSVVVLLAEGVDNG